MTLTEGRRVSRNLAWREEIRYLSLKRVDVTGQHAAAADRLDIGAPGGPVIPSEWIRSLSTVTK